MPWHFGPGAFYKTGYLLQFFLSIVQAWDNERCHFYPHTKLFHQLDRFKHRLETRSADLLVRLVIKCLQVDVNGIQIWRESACSFAAHISIAYEYVFYAFLLSYESGIIGKFIKDCWFGVCVGDRFAAGSFCSHDNLFGCAVLADDFTPVFTGILRDIKILAMLAVKVATHRPNGKSL